MSWALDVRQVQLGVRIHRGRVKLAEPHSGIDERPYTFLQKFPGDSTLLEGLAEVAIGTVANGEVNVAASSEARCCIVHHVLGVMVRGQYVLYCRHITDNVTLESPLLPQEIRQQCLIGTRWYPINAKRKKS